MATYIAISSTLTDTTTQICIVKQLHSYIAICNSDNLATSYIIVASYPTNVMET